MTYLCTTKRNEAYSHTNLNHTMNEELYDTCLHTYIGTSWSPWVSHSIQQLCGGKHCCGNDILFSSWDTYNVLPFMDERSMFWNDTEQAHLVHIEWAQKNDIQVECSSQRNTNFGPFTLAGGQCSTRCRILLSFLLSPMVTSSDRMDDVADTSGSNDFSMRCGWAFFQSSC